MLVVTVNLGTLTGGQELTNHALDVFPHSHVNCSRILVRERERVALAFFKKNIFLINWL